MTQHTPSVTTQGPVKASLIANLDGHNDRAWSVAWNPRSPILATCSTDKTVRLYKFRPSTASLGSTTTTTDAASSPAPTFELTESIPTGHSRSVRSLAWSPSGSTLATASFDSTIGIWERIEDVLRATGQQHEEYDAPSREGEAEWDCVGTLEGHDSECKDVKFSSNGGLLASCSRDKSVWIWEVQGDGDFECLSVLMEHTQDVKSLRFHPSEEILASASYDDTIKLYRDDPSEDWFCFQTIKGHDSTVWGLDFNPGPHVDVHGDGEGEGGAEGKGLSRKGRFLVSCSDDKTVRIWERDTEGSGESEKYKDRYTLVEVLKGWHDRTIYSVAWGSEGEKGGDEEWGRIASAGADGSIIVWGVAPPKVPEDGRIRLTHLVTIPDAHGDTSADINHLSWAPANLAGSSNPLRGAAEGRGHHDGDGEDEGRINEIPLAGWKGMRNMLASAADDGSVRVWWIPENEGTGTA